MGRPLMTFAALVLTAALTVGDLGMAAERSVPVGRRPAGGFNRVPITTPVVIIPQRPTAPLPPANSGTEPSRSYMKSRRQSSTWSGLSRRRSIGNLSPSAPVSSTVPSPASVRRRSMGNLSP